VSSVKYGSSAHNGLRPLTLAVGRGQACARLTSVLARDHRADFVCWPECSRGCLCRLPSITRFLVVGQTSPLTLHNVIPSICASFALIAAIYALGCHVSSRLFTYSSASRASILAKPHDYKVSPPLSNPSSLLPDHITRLGIPEHTSAQSHRPLTLAVGWWCRKAQDQNLCPPSQGGLVRWLECS
jgi:hypothetical protein